MSHTRTWMPHKESYFLDEKNTIDVNILLCSMQYLKYDNCVYIAFKNKTMTTKYMGIKINNSFLLFQ